MPIEKDESVRVVVIAGSGPAFCAGHDLKQMRANPRKAYYQKLFAQCSRVMLTITRIPQPVIARVHGIATAAGCQLVAQCDLAVASDNAKFAVSGHQRRAVLLDAERAAGPQRAAQAGDGDAAHRRLHRCAHRRAATG